MLSGLQVRIVDGMCGSRVHRRSRCPRSFVLPGLHGPSRDAFLRDSDFFLKKKKWPLLVNEQRSQINHRENSTGRKWSTNARANRTRTRLDFSAKKLEEKRTIFPLFGWEKIYVNERKIRKRRNGEKRSDTRRRKHELFRPIPAGAILKFTYRSDHHPSIGDSSENFLPP